MRIASSALALLLLMAPMAVAGDERDGRSIVTHLFESADADGSGTLDADEYAEAGLAAYGVPFEDCDENADGQTTLEEYLALYERHHPPGHGV